MPLVHNYDFDAPYATVEQLSPLVRRVVCNNPGPFTYKGTSTFIVGHGRVAVIDPGPAYGPHIDALMAAIGPEESIAAIMITHTHPDHSLGAEDLHQRTEAPRFGFGPHAGGSVPEEPEDEPVDFSAYISDDEQKAFAAEWEALPPEVKFEGYDLDFTPDHSLSDGETIDAAGSAHARALFQPPLLRTCRREHPVLRRSRHGVGHHRHFSARRGYGCVYGIASQSRQRAIPTVSPNPRTGDRRPRRLCAGTDRAPPGS